MVQNMESDAEHGVSISLPIPARNPQLFGSKATDDTLLFLTNHRFSQFSLREIAHQIGASHQTISRVVDILSENGLVVESSNKNQRLVQINRERLSIPDDPILRIPQPEFHKPVKTAVDKLTTELNNVVGIVLYGSVVRGEADRRSDIDIWVLTQGERAENQRKANAIARDLEETTYNGDRYAYDIDVEAVQAVPKYTEDIREILVSGIPVYQTEKFETVENLLLEEGGSNE
jgi:predicted nucleotidyltransferase/biotin operon repressor